MPPGTFAPPPPLLPGEQKNAPSPQRHGQRQPSSPRAPKKRRESLRFWFSSNESGTRAASSESLASGPATARASGTGSRAGAKRTRSFGPSRNVSLRSAQRKRDYAQAFDTAEAKAIGTTLKFDDFVPMMLEPWRAACSEDRHRTALRVVGVRPTFTMGPAYRIRAEEQRLAAIESELTTVNLAADQNDRVVEGLEGLKSAVIEEVRTKGKRGKKKRVAAAARAIRTNGGAGVSSSSSSTSAAVGEVEVPQQRQQAVGRILQVAVVSEAVLTAVGWHAVKKKGGRQ